MKYNKIPHDYFITIIDRLTRLTPAYIRYKRVFDDVINKFCTSDKVKNITIADNIKIACEIINNSLDEEFDNSSIYALINSLEDKYFKNNILSYQYLSVRLNYKGILKNIDINSNTPKNVIWFKRIVENECDIIKLRNEYSLLYPVEKIILCEGQTEYTLLSTIFKLFNYDFNKMGVLVIPAGGKNQVARKFYQMADIYNLPVYILLDSDAIQIKGVIENKLRATDKLYILKSGEFEDIIPCEILKNTINSTHSNELNCETTDFNSLNKNVENLEDIYKKYGFGEFKKAQFAQELKEYIKNYCNIENFKNSEINKLVSEFIN